MNTREAIQAMLEGNKVCRQSWARNAGYFYYFDGLFCDENGDVIIADLSGNDDWEIYEEQKQTVTIEKWLCKDDIGYFVVHCQNKAYRNLRVKLLDTYEVEL